MCLIQSVKTRQYISAGLVLSAVFIIMPLLLAASEKPEDNLQTFIRNQIEESKKEIVKADKDVTDCRDEMRNAQKNEAQGKTSKSCGPGIEYYQERTAKAKEKLKYYKDLKSMFDKTLQSPKKFGATLLRSVFAGTGKGIIIAPYQLEPFFPFFLRNDDFLKDLIKEACPITIKVKWLAGEKNDRMITRFLDTLQLKGQKSGISFVESDKKWTVSQEIAIIPQGKLQQDWFSQRVGGNLRILTKDNELKASWNNTVSAVHLTAEEANVQAAEKLADYTLLYVMQCLLEETNARRKEH